MEFKDRLKELRNEKSISAVALSKTLNKSESAIRMWESGKTKPDADTLIELSKMFDCSSDYLLGLSEVVNEKQREEQEQLNCELFNRLNDIPIEARGDLSELFITISDIIHSLYNAQSDKKVITQFLYYLKNINVALASLAYTFLQDVDSDETNEEKTIYIAVEKFSIEISVDEITDLLIKAINPNTSLKNVLNSDTIKRMREISRKYV